MINYKADQQLFPGIIQRFRKGIGGQRGLAQGSPSYARDSSFFFNAPFFLSPRRRAPTLGNLLAPFWALLPLPPTPFPNICTIGQRQTGGGGAQPPKPLLEASGSGVGLVGAHSSKGISEMMGIDKRQRRGGGVQNRFWGGGVVSYVYVCSSPEFSTPLAAH